MKAEKKTISRGGPALGSPCLKLFEMCWLRQHRVEFEKRKKPNLELLMQTNKIKFIHK